MIRRFFLPLFLLVALLAACHGPPEFGLDFESDSDLDRLRWKCGTLFSLSDQHATSGRFSLKAVLYPAPPGTDEDCPGLNLSDFQPDWRKAKSLELDLFFPGNEPLDLVVRIDDRPGTPPYEDRFNMSLPLQPGPNHLSIPLSGLKTSKTDRPLDRSNIEAVYFFLVRPARTTTLYFDRIRLAN